MLRACYKFFSGEKIVLHWRRLPWIFNKALAYIYTAANNRLGTAEYFHISQPRLNYSKALVQEAIFSYAISSKTSRSLARLEYYEDSKADGVQGLFCWKHLHEIESTLEPITSVYEDVLQLLSGVSAKNGPPANVMQKGCRNLPENEWSLSINKDCTFVLITLWKLVLTGTAPYAIMWHTGDKVAKIGNSVEIHIDVARRALFKLLVMCRLHSFCLGRRTDCALCRFAGAPTC